MMHDMSSIETTVAVARPRDEVFAYVADPRRFPEWNSAVESVVPLDHGRYEMRRRLPTGPATNELEVVSSRAPDELTIRTTSGPTPFEYRYEFATTAAGTLIRLHGDVQIRAGAALLGPLAAKAVKRGVDANFATLRAILERDGS
jgi:uncharacterized protein YndB with AHSA1/START domain